MSTPETVPTHTRLADGRDLYYYDEQPAAGRETFADKRELPDRAGAAQLRWDALREEWVAVAAARQTRPFLPAASSCPLCPSTPDNPTEIPAPSYDVAVFENRFPSFGGALDPRFRADATRREAVGRCEVVCFTAEHGAAFARLTERRARLVLSAQIDRTQRLSRHADVAQVFCFENRGEEIGVTLHHPHGQIYAFPFVAPELAKLLAAARRYRTARGDNLFAVTLAAERDGGRVVAANEHWTAFVPEAARWPFEVHFYPHVRAADLTELPGDHRDAFVPVYLDVLRRFDALFDAPLPYISAWYQGPTRADRDLAYTHLRLFSIRRAPGKLKYLAGSESAMGAFVNDVPPETAAQMLREAL